MRELKKLNTLLRIDHGERLSDMAAKLGVSAAYLSMVENEMRPPSMKVIEGIRNNYVLTEKEKKILEQIAQASSKTQLLKQFRDLPLRHRSLLVRIAGIMKNMGESELLELEQKISQKEEGVQS